jgi:hypothetical protein
MSLLQIRLQPEEYELLKQYASMKNISLVSAYREITSPSFESWKLNYLLNEFQTGNISLKTLWLKMKLPLIALFKVLEDNNISPPKTDILELASENRAQKIDFATHLKDPTKFIRESSSEEFTGLDEK